MTDSTKAEELKEAALEQVTGGATAGGTKAGLGEAQAASTIKAAGSRKSPGAGPDEGIVTSGGGNDI